MCDRTRLRHLKNTLYSKGAWQQVTRIEDLCHMHVSHKRPYHLDVCAGNVLPPHDYITNVQKRLGNRVWTGFGQCRLCGSFLDSQLEHGETCSPAEATRGHYACVHAVLGGLKLADAGITTEPRGLTEAQSRPADIFTTTVRGRSAAVDLCLSQRSSSSTVRKQPLIENPHTAANKYQIFVIRASSTARSSSSARLFGQQMGGRTRPSPEHCSTQQTSHPAATANRCRQNRSNTDGNMKFR